MKFAFSYYAKSPPLKEAIIWFPVAVPISSDEPDPGRNPASRFNNKTKDDGADVSNMNAQQATVLLIQLLEKPILAIWPLR